MNRILYSYVQILTWEISRYIFPPTNVVYEDFAKQRGFEPDTVKLEHGGLGHWIGDKTAGDVVVYFHGKESVLESTTYKHLINIYENICIYRYVNLVVDFKINS
jgi:hypothetical protein